ncbi:hypothetical protein FBU30_004958 [Linnemannia zychae]|nr:hypothetical protein FBU30_004958 [Linnemannia zychae]
MKFIPSILLISAAIASVTNAAPLVGQNIGATDVQANVHANIARTLVTKRCADCTSNDDAALDVIIKASADHYAEIAHVRLDNLMRELATAKVTSGTQELPKEKALMTISVQNSINEAKKACSPEQIVPVIKAAVAADVNLDVAWSKKDDKEIEKKLVALEAKVNQVIVDRIQITINAESLSKDCTEKMTNTEIAPAPEGPGFSSESLPTTSETLAPIPETTTPTPETPAPIPEAPAPVPEAPAPEASTPVPESSIPAQEASTPAPEESTPVPEAPAPVPETSVPTPESTDNNSGLKVGIDIAASVDPKFVCKSGCNDSEDAKNVLSLRVNLEKELKPRLDHFYAKEVSAAYDEKRPNLLDGVLNLLSGLRINVDADVKANN